MDPTWSFEAFYCLQGAANAGLLAAKTDELSPAVIPLQYVLECTHHRCETMDTLENLYRPMVSSVVEVGEQCQDHDRHEDAMKTDRSHLPVTDYYVNRFRGYSMRKFNSTRGRNSVDSPYVAEIASFSHTYRAGSRRRFLEAVDGCEARKQSYK
jgi:hypothetical protein